MTVWNSIGSLFDLNCASFALCMSVLVDQRRRFCFLFHSTSWHNAVIINEREARRSKSEFGREESVVVSIAWCLPRLGCENCLQLSVLKIHYYSASFLSRTKFSRRIIVPLPPITIPFSFFPTIIRLLFDKQFSDCKKMKRTFGIRSRVLVRVSKQKGT